MDQPRHSGIEVSRDLSQAIPAYRGGNSLARLQIEDSRCSRDYLHPCSSGIEVSRDCILTPPRGAGPLLQLTSFWNCYLTQNQKFVVSRDLDVSRVVSRDLAGVLSSGYH